MHWHRAAQRASSCPALRSFSGDANRKGQCACLHAESSCPELHSCCHAMPCHSCLAQQQQHLPQRAQHLHFASRRCRAMLRLTAPTPCRTNGPGLLNGPKRSSSSGGRGSRALRVCVTLVGTAAAVPVLILLARWLYALFILTSTPAVLSNIKVIRDQPWLRWGTGHQGVMKKIPNSLTLECSTPSHW